MAPAMLFKWRISRTRAASHGRRNIMDKNPVTIRMMAVFGMCGIVIFAYGRSDIFWASISAYSYRVCARFNGQFHPIGAVIVPIITAGIIANENIGNNTRLPIRPYTGIE